MNFSDQPEIDSPWISKALEQIEADYQRSADTHLIRLNLPQFTGIDFYFKDESTHPSGSLKHRLARSLFLYGLCNGWIKEGTTIVEASSGSTAVSEAYFARLIGLPFIAVMPEGTSIDKVNAIAFYGGQCHFVANPNEVYEASRRIAEQTGGHFMDQFTYAERATDWRGNNNIAESIFLQMAHERHPIPTWIVMGAGTGGTSATIGRYIRFRRFRTSVCVVDPVGSVFYDYWIHGNKEACCESRTMVEGIGRQRVEPSFIRTLVDRMIQVPDAQSFASMRTLSALLNRKVGGSTGTNFTGMIELAREMRLKGQTGSIVTLICDSGERYQSTYFDEQWLTRNKLIQDLERYQAALEMVV